MKRVCFNCAPRALVRKVIARAWRKHGSVRAAAKALGVPRATFHDRAVALGIAGPR